MMVPPSPGAEPRFLLPASPEQPRFARRGATARSVRLRALALALALVGGGYAAWRLAPWSPAVWRRQRLALRAQIESPQPQERKAAAWTAIELRDPFVEVLMVDGLYGREPSPDVREAYVYSLGRMGDPTHLNAVRFALQYDDSGYVRAAAWLSAARLLPAAFRALALTQANPDSTWDRLGVAQGFLTLGDPRGLDDLLALAAAPDAQQRWVASNALEKGLYPLLDAAGAWPLEADPQARVNGTWPLELTTEVRRRMARLDLAAIAGDTLERVDRLAPLRRSVGKINRARETIAATLFGALPPQAAEGARPDAAR